MATKKAAQGLAIPKANPGTTWTWIVNLLVTILRPILAIISPMIRTELEKFVLKLYVKAEATDNPWDDFLAEFLLKMLGLETPSG